MVLLRRLFLTSLFTLASGCGDGGESEDVPTHLRVTVNTNFPDYNLRWLDVVVDWGSDCQEDTWFVLPVVPGGHQADGTGRTVSLPTSFDVLPQNDASMESVTVFVAGIGAYGPVSVDSRTVGLKAGERVTAELFLSNKCAPQSCDHSVDDFVDGYVERVENWCSMGALDRYRPASCTCGSIGIGAIDLE